MVELPSLLAVMQKWRTGQLCPSHQQQALALGYTRSDESDWSKLEVANLIGPLECDEEKRSQNTLNILDPFSNCFSGALYRMATRDKYKPLSKVQTGSNAVREAEQEKCATAQSLQSETPWHAVLQFSPDSSSTSGITPSERVAAGH